MLASSGRTNSIDLLEIVTHGVEIIVPVVRRRPESTSETAAPRHRLERLINQLVNKAKADMVAGIETSRQAYENSHIGRTASRSAAFYARSRPRLHYLLVADRSWQASNRSGSSIWLLPANSPIASMSSIATNWARWGLTSTRCRRNWIGSISSCASARTIFPNRCSSRRRPQTC